MSQFKFCGISDEVTVCECCGKTNLRKTIILTNGEGEMHYGTDCASKAIHGNNKAGNKKSVERIANAVATLRRWLIAGHSPEVSAKGIWNKFGVGCSVKADRIVIGSCLTSETYAEIML